MIRVRTINDVYEFAGVPGDPEGYADLVSEMWDSGESRPEWCFLVEDGPTRVGRVGFRVAPTVSDRRWLGSLPPNELFLFGLHLQWEDDYLEAGRRLISEGLAAISSEVPELLEVRINNSFHLSPDAQVHLMGALGMELFQQKHGFSWTDGGRSEEPADRLEFRSIAEVGADAYRAVMAPCGAETLDRNDRYYWAGCGPDNWASQMTEYLVDADAPMWLVGFRNDEPVGYVAVVRDEEWGATIGHVGITPEHRGNGYIHDLLEAGNRVGRRSGIATMLSDVDVLNSPMIEAMQRAGHSRDPQRWHVRVYRSRASELVVP